MFNPQMKYAMPVNSRASEHRSNLACWL